MVRSFLIAMIIITYKNLVLDDVLVLEAESDVADGGLGLLGDDLAQVTYHSPMQRDHFLAR